MTQQQFAGRTCTEWNRDWKPLKGGLGQRHADLRGSVGVFRLRLGKEVVYIGCGREYSKGGLMKRLFDFSRESDSGRKHHAGQKIYEHRATLEVDVIVTGTDYSAGVIAQRLKGALLGMKKPAWNVART
ncbi:hypothetical protein [Novosphingobium lindaniclasticum]|nr:hypothetical protein [Novosphingobium lindaniclasticum]